MLQRCSAFGQKGECRVVRAPFLDAYLAPDDVQRPWWPLIKDFVSLTKPRLSGLVLFTTAGGMWLSHASLSWATWLHALVGTAGTVGAANAFNCVIERESDALMRRTAQRPLPAARLTAPPALLFAALLTAASLPLLAVGVNLLTAALGLFALLLYVTVYTPLKARTHWAMWVGAISGALPPLMGWTAARGRIELPGLVLFGILFCWQLPHFIAIALFRKDEYRAAGLMSLPLAKGDDVARFQATLTSAALLLISLLPTAVGVAGWVYAAVALALGIHLLVVAFAGWRRKGDERWARQLFRVSLVYLTGLFAALACSQ